MTYKTPAGETYFVKPPRGRTVSLDRRRWLRATFLLENNAELRKEAKGLK